MSSIQRALFWIRGTMLIVLGAIVLGPVPWQWAINEAGGPPQPSYHFFAERWLAPTGVAAALIMLVVEANASSRGFCGKRVGNVLAFASMLAFINVAAFVLPWMWHDRLGSYTPAWGLKVTHALCVGLSILAVASLVLRYTHSRRS